MEPLEDRRMLATLWVDSVLDNVDADAHVTLREAIIAANTDTATDLGHVGSGDDTIMFDTVVFDPNLPGKTILLDNLLGEMEIWSNVVIDGADQDVTISGQDGPDQIYATGDGHRIFHILERDPDVPHNPLDQDVILVGLTLTGGDEGTKITAGNLPGFADIRPLVAFHQGGAILNYGNLTIQNSTIEHNAVAVYAVDLIPPNGIDNVGLSATVHGGAISSGESSTLTIEEGTIIQWNEARVDFSGAQVSEYSASADGGGIHADDAIEVVISDSEISNNKANVNTSGILKQPGSAGMLGSGAASRGGGLFYTAPGPPLFGGPVTITDSTIDRNFAVVTSTSEFLVGGFGRGPSVQGGGLFVENAWELSIQGSTISRNHAKADVIFPASSRVIGIELQLPLVLSVGGGLSVHGSGTVIVSSTLSGNEAYVYHRDYSGDFDSAGVFGGGIYSSHYQMDISHTTIAHNRVVWNEDTANRVTTADGGGIYHEKKLGVPGQLDLSHVLSGNNFLHDESVGPLVSTGNDLSVSNVNVRAEYCLIEHYAPASLNLDDPTLFNITGEQDTVTTTLGLRPLANYGGPTETHALRIVSPAVDAGDPGAQAGVNVPEFDQRGVGYPRIVDVATVPNEPGQIDIGAFELQHPDGSDGPVQVDNVIISGSSSEHDPYSFLNVVGSGEQLRTVPVGGADTISIVFSEDADVDAVDLWIVGLYTANEPSFVSFDYDPVTATATWTFDGWALGDQYALTLDSENITDVDGNELDGEWTNPANIMTTNEAVSEFPSGDGTAGGDFAFVMTLLAGDADLDNDVDGDDFLIWQTSFGMNVGAVFTDSDSDGDGDVDGDDFLIWQQTFGSNLQALWILADLDSDYDVDMSDFWIMYPNQGMNNPTWADGDLNGDGQIDIDDFYLWSYQFGLDLDVVA